MNRRYIPFERGALSGGVYVDLKPPAWTSGAYAPRGEEGPLTISLRWDLGLLIRLSPGRATLHLALGPVVVDGVVTRRAP